MIDGRQNVNTLEKSMEAIKPIYYGDTSLHRTCIMLATGIMPEIAGSRLDKYTWGTII